jgi:16S rRNA C967 or C1407 C5-methylase (RsmB/RsmF family)
MVLNYDSINLKRLNIRANKILLDVPCTGEGLIRQDKSRKLSKSINDINKMASIQKKLLKAGLSVLKPGGKLVYSTCSIAPEEDELVVNSVLQNNPQYTIENLNFQYGLNGFTKIYGKNLMKDLSKSQRFFPHIHDTIGFYICLLKKS